MPAFSNWAESGVLNLLFRSNTNSFGAPTNVSVALCRNVPLETDIGATLPELTFANGYGRANLGAPANATWSETAQDSVSSGFIQNASTITFGPATADWGYVSGVAICTSFGVNSGNVILFGALQTPRDIKSGDTFQFSAQAIGIYLG